MKSDENKSGRYEAITRDIRVSVMPHYLDAQSDPESDHFVWAYEVEIVNEGRSTVQLRERTWLITDANGKRERVHGPGVVGEQPILNPGGCLSIFQRLPANHPIGVYGRQLYDERRGWRSV